MSISEERDLRKTCSNKVRESVRYLRSQERQRVRRSGLQIWNQLATLINHEQLAPFQRQFLRKGTCVRPASNKVREGVRYLRSQERQRVRRSGLQIWNQLATLINHEQFAPLQCQFLRKGT